MYNYDEFLECFVCRICWHIMSHRMISVSVWYCDNLHCWIWRFAGADASNSPLNDDKRWHLDLSKVGIEILDYCSSPYIWRQLIQLSRGCWNERVIITILVQWRWVKEIDYYRFIIGHNTDKSYVLLHKRHWWIHRTDKLTQIVDLWPQTTNNSVNNIIHHSCHQPSIWHTSLMQWLGSLLFISQLTGTSGVSLHTSFTIW